MFMCAEDICLSGSKKLGNGWALQRSQRDSRPLGPQGTPVWVAEGNTQAQVPGPVLQAPPEGLLEIRQETRPLKPPDTESPLPTVLGMWGWHGRAV